MLTRTSENFSQNWFVLIFNLLFLGNFVVNRFWSLYHKPEYSKPNNYQALCFTKVTKKSKGWENF